MSFLDRLVSAFHSHNLADRRQECDLHRIGAAGFASARKPLAMALYELKYRAAADGSGLDRGKLREVANGLAGEILGNIRRKGWRIRRKDDPEALALACLTWWLERVCRHCEGRRYEVVPGTPMLSDRVCPVCEGAGKPPLQATLLESFPRQTAEVMALPAQWVVGRLDQLEAQAGEEYIARLGRGFNLDPDPVGDPWDVWG